MQATIMYRAGDVRVENVADAKIVNPTDALVRVTRACICGSDLWPYKDMKPSANGRPMGHEAIGVVEAVGKEVRKVKKGDFVVMPFADLLPDVLEGRIQPGRVLDRTIGLGEVPDGYRAMDEREAIKVMVKP
jgi:threonine dehydrogenase-like Zn-dependent dehydrogenase